MFFRDGRVIGESGLFSTPVFSPRNQRERSCSRNRVLGFEIRAYSGLIPRSDGRVMIENYWEAWRVA